MYLILNSAKLVMDISPYVQYVRRQSNKIVVGCPPENADAVYSASADTFFPLDPLGYIGDGHTLAEVTEIPEGVIAGYYYYRAGEFYTTEEDLSRLARERAQADLVPVANVLFVTLAESGQLDDTTATEHASQFSEWAYPIAYTLGQIRRYADTLFRCVQAHTSQADWTPPAAASLWAKIGDPTEEWPEWAQPVGAHDAYVTGDKVTYNGKHWTSDIDNNVWAPGVHGWTVAK